MTPLRRHLGAWTLAWLIVQVASVCAVAVFDASRPSHTLAEAQKDCLGQGPAEQCPMHDAEGRPCPMHQDSGSPSHTNDRTCALRATHYDDGIFASLFSIPGVLLDTVSDATDSSSPLTIHVSSHVPLAPAFHDTPPPRA